MRENVIQYLKHVQSDKKQELEKQLKAKIIFIGNESNYTIRPDSEPKNTLIMTFNSKGPVFKNLAGGVGFAFPHIDKKRAEYLLALHRQLESIGHTIGIVNKHQISQENEHQQGLFNDDLATL